MEKENRRGSMIRMRRGFRAPSPTNHTTSAIHTCERRRLQLLNRLHFSVHLTLLGDPKDPFDLLLHLGHQSWVVLQIQLGVLTPLSDALATIAVPGTRLVDNSSFGRNIE